MFYRVVRIYQLLKIEALCIKLARWTISSFRFKLPAKTKGSAIKTIHGAPYNHDRRIYRLFIYLNTIWATVVSWCQSRHGSKPWYPSFHAEKQLVQIVTGIHLPTTTTTATRFDPSYPIPKKVIPLYNRNSAARSQVHTEAEASGEIEGGKWWGKKQQILGLIRVKNDGKNGGKQCTLILSYVPFYFL